MIQPRFAPEILERIEKRARELGYIHPSGKTNLAGYASYCILKEMDEAKNTVKEETK
jgi:hypothetical protein